MNIRQNVEVGQVWTSNDVRRFGTRIKVTRIVCYETGRNVPFSRVNSPTAVETRDRVHVENLDSQKKTVITRRNFITGVRGWSLHQDTPHDEHEVARFEGEGAVN